MAKVALCSERILGVEMLGDLAACASELSAQGHSVSLICSNLSAAHAHDEFKGIALFQSPNFVYENDSSAKLKARPRCLSELLITQGYQSKMRLAPVLRGWLHLLATLDVDHVISDHAPTALLASRLLSVSSVMIGDGFRVPPKINPLPGFRPWRSDKEKLLKDQAQAFVDDQLLLKSINESVIELGFNGMEISSPDELYQHADQWIMSVPEMDHYGSRDIPYVVRWPNTNSHDDAAWPKGDGDKVFVVLNASSSHCEALFEQLSTLDLPVLAVVEDASAHFINRFSSDKLIIQNEMVSIASVVQHCKIVFSHGEHDLIYQLLLKGVPSVLLPQGIQNTLLTYRLAKKRLGFAGPSKASKLDVNRLIESTKKVDQVWHNASRFSLKYENHSSLTRLHDLIKALCA